VSGAARAALKRSFLDAAGWAGAEFAHLAGDASNRSYDRVTRNGATAVLMDAPPERGEDVGRFVALTRVLRERGLSAPEVLTSDLARGFLLLEDLGDALFARVCAADPAAEAGLYAAAADLLAELHAAPPPEGEGVPPYDAALLRSEAERLTDWWLPAATEAPVSQGLTDELLGRLDEAAAEVAQDRSALVLRDFHAENLVWLPEREGAARVGLLDYQDALIGSPAYDLASLLEDARRDTSDALRRDTLARYLAASGAEPEGFAAAYAVLAAQRNMKIVGLFARLWLRDGKPRYLDLIPRVWGHLMRDLEHPRLAPLRAVVSRHVPPPTPETLARVRAARSVEATS
jgi:N-acetylmuramate 1-kinase